MEIKIKDYNLKRIGLGIALFLAIVLLFVILMFVKVAGEPLMLWVFLFGGGGLIGYLIIWEGGKLLAEWLFGVDSWRE